MRTALDTDVIVAALRSPLGASRQILHALRSGKIETVASITMFIEYEAVLKRPEQLGATGLCSAEVDQFLDGLASLIIPVTPHFLWRPQLRDPNDEMVLEAAVNGMAQTIVTFNRRDYLPAAKRFDLDIVLPSVLIRRLT
jgi:putative PIN family toxin of toxin-antitoxin system